MLGLKIKTALQASILFTFGFWLLFFLSEGELFSFFLIMFFFLLLFRKCDIRCPSVAASYGGSGGVQGDGYEYSYTYFSVGCDENMDDHGTSPGIEDILYEEGLINQTFD